MKTDYEAKVKSVYPQAVAFAGIAGWGIWVPDVVLIAYGRHSTASAAWKYAWTVVRNGVAA